MTHHVDNFRIYENLKRNVLLLLVCLSVSECDMKLAVYDSMKKQKDLGQS